MNKKIFIVIGFIFLFSLILPLTSSIWGSARIEVDTVNATYSFATNSVDAGWIFNVSSDLMLLNITKHGTVTAPTARLLLNSTGAVLSSKTFDASYNAVFNYTLTAGVVYRVTAYNGGSDYTWGQSLATASFPQIANSTYIFGGFDGTSLSGQIFNIVSITLQDNQGNVTLVSPTNNFVTTNTSLYFNASGNRSIVNVKNATLYVWYNNGSVYKTNTTTFSGTNTFESALRNIGGFLFGFFYKWNYNFCDTNSLCAWATSNWTFSRNNVITTFNISLTDENITFTGNQNNTRWLSVPKLANITSGLIGLGGYDYSHDFELDLGNWKIDSPSSNINFSNDWSSKGIYSMKFSSAGFADYLYIDDVDADKFNNLVLDYNASFSKNYWQIYISTNGTYSGSSKIFDFSSTISYNQNINLTDYTGIKRIYLVSSQCIGIPGACTGAYWDYAYVDNIRFCNEQNCTLYPNNATLSFNQTTIFNHTGVFNTTNNQTLQFNATLQSALNSGTCDCQDCQLIGAYCNVPFTFHSDTAGLFNYNNIQVVYSLPNFLLSLDTPANNSWVKKSDDFTCSQDFSGGLINSTFLIWNSSSNLYYNSTQTITGESNSTTFNTNFTYSDTMQWNCHVYDITTNQFFESNYTARVDALIPNVSINGLSTTAGSQTFTFNSTEQDENLDSCFYSIFNSSGSIDGTNSNVTYTCGLGLSHSATVTAYATYNLTTYGQDLAGNLNFSIQNFTTSATVSTIVGTGGGGGGGEQTSKVICLQQINSSTLYQPLERCIIYARIRDSCLNTTDATNCQLTETDKLNTLGNILAQDVQLELNDFNQFFIFYKNNNIEEISLTRSSIDNFNLFESTLQIVEAPFKVSPPSLDSFFIVTSSNSIFKYQVNSGKTLSSVRIDFGDPNLNVELLTDSSALITYKIDNLDFFAKRIEGQIIYTSIDGENVFQPVLIRAIYIFSPSGLIGISLLVLLGVLSYKKRKNIVRFFKNLRKRIGSLFR